MRFDYFDMLSGEPIPVRGVGRIRSPSLREIGPGGLGYNVYNLYLNLLSWDKEKLLKYDQLMGLRGTAKVAAAEKLTVFDVATLLVPTRDLYREVLSFFMLEDLEWSEKGRKFVAYTTDDDGQHVTGEINRNNFEDVRDLMLQCNYVGLDKDDEPTKHTSERSKELWEKAQQFLKEQKKDAEDRPEFHIGNIVSKLCAVHSGYTFLNVFDLTVFQMYDAFFQCGYLRSADLSENIFSNHGGKTFKFEDWLRPIFKHA